MPTDTELKQLVINELTEEQYKGLTPNKDELYLTPDPMTTNTDGSVTLNQGLTVSTNGNVEVGKNLEVDGGASFLGQALKILDAQDSNSDVIGHFIGYVDEENEEAAGIIVDPNDAGINYSFTNLPFLSLKENSLITFDVTLNTLKETSAITNSGLFAITLKDNIKTIFGNQSLVGSGNIDLYRHEIIVSIAPDGENSASTAKSLKIEYISSNSLICDSLQDLRTLLKSTTTTRYIQGDYFSARGFATSGSAPSSRGTLAISTSVATISTSTIGGSTLGNVVAVSDTVTTI